MNQERVKRNEYPSGKPNSVERLLQTKRLWSENHSDLHIRLSREHKVEWFNWANNVDEGKSYFCSAPASGPSNGPHLPPLRELAPLGSDLSNPQLSRQLLNEAGARLRAGLGPEAYSSSLQSQRAQGKRRRLLDESGFGVTITGSRVNLFTTKKRVSLNIPQSSMGKISTSPSVICDEQRNIVLLNNRGDTITLWTKAKLQSLANFNDIREYWELRTKLKWEKMVNTTSPMSSGALSSSSSPSPSTNPWQDIPRGPPPLTGTGPANSQTSAKEAQGKPPKKSDGMWLMNKFLNGEFPNGGWLFSGNLEKFPEHRKQHWRTVLAKFLKGHVA